MLPVRGGCLSGPGSIPPEEGRALFGGDAAGYEEARPDYPERVYELLVERCGLAPGCRTLEVGAGSGGATRRVLALGARPLVAVEPDRRFAPALESLADASGGALAPLFVSLEAAALEERSFDLAFAATSFHWLQRDTGLGKLGACLRSGGWLALFWNVFGDPRRADPFHDATHALLSGLADSPSNAPEGELPFALDREARCADLRAAGADADLVVEELRWTLTLRPDQVRSLYATFSPVARLAATEREALLARLEAIAESDFGGSVEREMVTPVYLGRRA